MAAVGLGNSGGDVVERGGPYFVRDAQDSTPTSQLLDDYSPALFCMFRNFHDVDIKAARVLGGNGYSSNGMVWLMGAGNPYVYPDNLPRVNARGGPEGRPGCWQPITRDLWPAPYLVMDTGASIAPYNHFELGQPMLIDYVWDARWGRTPSTHSALSTTRSAYVHKRPTHHRESCNNAL
jgi:phospholipid/cholesterol/gamma-HCH transport system substrate-binding protein